MLALRGGSDVIVATPGRLLDLVSSNAIKLDQVKTLVLDEADLGLSLIDYDDYHHIKVIEKKKRIQLSMRRTPVR